jgi:hypothetical protein
MTGRIPSASWERIAAKASANNIPAPPAINVVNPTADVPSEIARFVGAWGPGIWIGDAANHFILVIERADAKGNAQLVRMSSGQCDNVECAQRSARIDSLTGRIENGKLSFTEKSGGRYVFEIGIAGWLEGTNPQVNSLPHSTSPMARIE